MSFGGSLGSAQGELLIDIQQALANLTTLENRVKGLNGVGGDALTGLESGAGSRLDRTTNKLNNFSKGAQILGKAGLGAGIAVAAGFGLAVNSAANFEQSMSFVSAALGGVGGDAGITKDQFQALSDEALNIGATTSVSAGEAAQAMELLGKAGLDATDILQGGARAVVDISQATGESIQQSAASFGALQNLFADTGISAADMADAIVVGMNSSNATLSEFQTGISRLAPVIAQTGLSFNDSAAAIAYFNSRGFSAAEVGTSLTAAFNNLANPTAEAATAMQDLGIAAFDSQGNFVGFPKIMDDVAAATAGMSDEQRNAVLSTIFGADAMDLMADSAKTGGDGLRDLTEKTKEQGIAAKQSAERMNNFKGAIETFKGAIGSLAIAIGTPLLGPLRAITEALARMVEMFLKLPKGVQTTIAAIVAIAGAIAGVLGAIVVFGPTIAAVLALFAEGGMLAGVAAAIGALAAPILLVVAALALLGLAYKTNFLGFADAVNGIAGAVAGKLTAVAKGIAHFASQVGAAFGAFKSAGQNPIAAGFNAIGLELEAVAGKFGPFSGLVKNTAKEFRALGSAAQQGGKILKGVQATYRDLVKNGMSPVAAGLKALGAAFVGNSSLFGRFAPVAEGVGRALGVAGDFVESFVNRFKQLYGTMDTAQAIFQALGDAVSNIAGHFGPLEDAVLKVGDALRSIGEAVGDFIDAGQAILGGDYSEAWDELKSAVGNVGNAIKDFGGAATSALGAAWDALSGVDWGGVLDTIGSGLSTLGDLALQGLGALSTKLLEWVQEGADAVRDYDWGGLFDNVKDVTGDIVQKLGQLGVAVLTWAQQAISSINWSSLFNNITDVTAAIVKGFGDLGVAVITWAVDAISSINWSSLFNNITDVTADIIKGFGQLGVAVLTWAQQAISGVNWSSLFNNITDVTAQIIKGFGQLGVAVLTWAQEAISGINWSSLFNNIVDVTADIVKGLGNLTDAIFNWVSDAVTGVDWGLLASNIGLALGLAIGAAKNFAADLTATILSELSDAMPTAGELGAIAGSLAQTLGNAIRDAIGKVKNFAADIGATILSELRDAIPTTGELGEIGSTLASNLGSALQSGISGMENFAANLGQTILSELQQMVASVDMSGIASAIVSKLFDAIKAVPGGSWALDVLDIDQQVEPAKKLARDMGTEVGGSLREGLNEALTTGKNDFSALTESVTAPLKAMAEQATISSTAVGTAMTTMGTTIVTAAVAAGVAIATMGTFIGTAMSTTSAAVSSASATMGAALNQFAAAAGSAGQRAGSTFQQSVTSGMNAARGAVTSAAGAMTATLNQLASAAGQAGSQGGQSFSRGIQQGMSSATSAAQSGRSSIISAMTLPNMFGVGLDAGSSLGQGVAAGINAQVGAVQAAAAAIVAAAAGAMAIAGMFGSPSRLTARYGRWFTEGFTIGIERGTPGAIEAVAKLIPTRPVDTMMAFGDRPVSSSSATSITNVFALKSEELVRLMRDAETGGAYARETTFLLGAH